MVTNPMLLVMLSYFQYLSVYVYFSKNFLISDFCGPLTTTKRKNNLKRGIWDKSVKGYSVTSSHIK